MINSVPFFVTYDCLRTTTELYSIHYLQNIYGGIFKPRELVKDENEWQEHSSDRGN